MVRPQHQQQHKLTQKLSTWTHAQLLKLMLIFGKEQEKYHLWQRWYILMKLVKISQELGMVPHNLMCQLRLKFYKLAHAKILKQELLFVLEHAILGIHRFYWDKNQRFMNPGIYYFKRVMIINKLKILIL